MAWSIRKTLVQRPPNSQGRSTDSILTSRGRLCWRTEMKKLLTVCTLISFVFTAVLNAQQTRTEKDLLGEKQIPADAYYGVQTARALENFQISGVKTNFYPDYVKAYAIVKLAAARANTE